MADSPYTSQSISGYNTNPPPDDGTESAANRVDWATIKTKLPDPIKTLSEAINTALVTAFGLVINTGDDQANLMTGSLAFGSSALTIASGSVTPTRSMHSVDTEGAAATDDLDTLATGSVSDGAIVMLISTSTARVITVKDGDGNINLYGNRDIDLDTETPLVLRRNGANWNEVAGGQAPSFHHIETLTASSSAALSFSKQIENYKAFLVVWHYIVPATDAAVPQLQISKSASFQTSGYDATSKVHVGATDDLTNAADSLISAHGVGNVATEGVSGFAVLFPGAAAVYPSAVAAWMLGNAAAAFGVEISGGAFETVGAIDGVRIKFDSGNIASGTAAIYGILG